jgi:hypothetical protein
MTTTINLNKNDINAIDMSSMYQYIDWQKDNFKYFNLPAGEEHYRLLCKLSELLPPGDIIDIGTYFGFSAAALSFNSKQNVISYDIYDWLPDDQTTVKNILNVQTKVMNCLNDIDLIKKANLIVIDISHNGSDELEILNALREAKYDGLVFLDDVGLNQEMKDLAESIPEKKIDVSCIGHWSSSLIVIMDPSKFDIILETI